MKLVLIMLLISAECSLSARFPVQLGLATLIYLIKEWTLSGISDVSWPEEFLTIHQLIEREGFTAEKHEVTTADGYILPLTRILPKRVDGWNQPPILLVHGVEAASDQWVLRGQEDLAFMLVNHGFDVWLADTRGNCYSRKHQNLTDVDAQFWNFSFHEIGAYDIPAFVEYLLNVTTYQQIGYIGHSMGTTEFLIFASLFPEYNRKVWASVLLAPVGPKFPSEDIKNSIMRLVFTNLDFIFEILEMAGVLEFHPRTPGFVSLFFEYCNDSPFLDYCLDIVGMVAGEHRENLDKANCTLQLSHFPSGTSTKTLHHLGQVFVSGFKQYDYGPEKNKLKYNSTSPPPYPIHQITTPTFLFYGGNDPWTSSKVVNYLAETIPGVKLAKLVPDLKFTHLDFLIGANTNDTLYQDVIGIMKDYNNGS